MTSPGARRIVEKMVSLASIVAAHGSALVLDAATTHVQAGFLRAGAPRVWRTGGSDSSIHLFEAARECLGAAGISPGAVGAYVFCEGPGSQLGIRTACMALRTWQAVRAAPAPVFAYRSLTVAALSHARSGGAAPFAAIADARRDCWHAVRIAADGTASAVLRLPAAELRDWPEPLLQPEGFRSWSPPPRTAGACPYSLAGIFGALATEPLLAQVGEPEPWLPAAPTYKTWTADRHRAPHPHP